MSDETKAQKFVRLAEKRVTKALAELRKVGNLAGPTYEHTAEQVRAIIAALEDAVGNINAQFYAPCSAEKEAFSFVDWLTDESDEDDDGIETVEHTDENP